MWNDFFKDYEYKKTVQACEIQGNMSHVYKLLEENSYFLERHTSKSGSIKTTFYMLHGNDCSVSGEVGDFLVIENLNKEDFKAYICPKEEFLQEYNLKTEENCDKRISDLTKELKEAIRYLDIVGFHGVQKFKHRFEEITGNNK